MEHKSELEKCHNRYCNTLLDDFLNEKITKPNFLHLYYNALIPLSLNYRFPIPERVKHAVNILEGYN
jgi:hypothetical protein